MGRFGRILRSSPWQLLRGRAPGNWRDDVASLRLPPELDRLITRTVRRIGLGRRVRDRSAVALAVGFAERIESGLPAAAIAADHGSPRRAARRLRREILMRLPVSTRLVFLLRLIGPILLAGSVLSYGYLAVVYSTDRPWISQDYVAAWNARVPTAAPDERAWPEIHRLYEALRFSESEPFSKNWPNLEPDSPEWQAAVTFFDARSPAVDELRAVARRRVLGFEVSGPSLHQANLLHLGKLRSHARVLKFDALRALHEGDANRAVENLHAALTLARYCNEHGTSLGHLTEVAICAMVCGLCTEVIHEYPGAFSDAQLEALADHLTRLAKASGRISLQSEREFCLDLAQRLFTDNGRGDGRVCAAGRQNLRRISGDVSTPSLPERLLAPLAVERFGTRKQFMDECSRFWRLLEQRNALPLWQRMPPEPVEVEADRVLNNPGALRVHRMAAIPVVAHMKAGDTTEQHVQVCDATLTAIAIERFRLATGAPPRELSELVPCYLPALPLDRFDGQALKYRLIQSQPILYSVGADSNDDGGRPMRNDRGEIVEIDMNRRTPRDGDWIFFPPPRALLRIEP